MVETEAYQFQISPNNPPFILNVSNDQLNGICTMAYCIYGDKNVEHMFKFGRVGDGKLGDYEVRLLMADDTFVLANDQSHGSELPMMEPGQTWLQYLQSIEDAVDIEEYMCIFKDVGWVLVKFDNLEFLQGAIGLCRWLGKEWNNIILHLHHEENIINIPNFTF